MGSDDFSGPSNEKRPVRLGLFGGTFNPIHLGHYQAAVEVLRLFDLDRIYFIPSALPPHKSESTLATAEDRFEMVRLALREHPRLQGSKVELQRSGPSYTIDTIADVKAQQPAGSYLYFMLGLDAFLEINTWKSYRQLLEQADFIVMSRPHAGSSDACLETAIESYARERFSPDYHLALDGRSVEHHHYHPIFPVRITPVDISSSQIRKMISLGQDVSPWVLPPVHRYICQKGLYR